MSLLSQLHVPSLSLKTKDKTNFKKKSQVQFMLTTTAEYRCSVCDPSANPLKQMDFPWPCSSQMPVVS